MYFLVNSFLGIIPKAVIKFLYNVGKLSSKVMTISSSRTHTSKQALLSTSALTLLMSSHKSSPSCILHVKKMQQMNRMFNKLFVSWILQKDLHVFSSHLQFLMNASWLSTKLSLMMEIFLFTIILYSIFNFGVNIGRWSYLEFVHNASKVHKTNLISNLNFQKSKFSSLNLSMTLALLPQMMPCYAQRLGIYSLITQINVFLEIKCTQWLDELNQHV